MDGLRKNRLDWTIHITYIHNLYFSFFDFLQHYYLTLKSYQVDLKFEFVIVYCFIHPHNLSVVCCVVLKNILAVFDCLSLKYCLSWFSATTRMLYSVSCMFVYSIFFFSNYKIEIQRVTYNIVFSSAGGEWEKNMSEDITCPVFEIVS